MMALKSCPRCRGDLVQEEFLGEVELVCIQCGYRAAAAAPAPALAGRLTRAR